MMNNEENMRKQNKTRNKSIKRNNKKEFNKIWRIEYKEWGRLYDKN